MSTITSFFKKRCNPDKDTEAETTPNKRQRKADIDRSVQIIQSVNPKRIVCWNCNGLSVRVRNETNMNSIRSFLRTKQPDIFFLSEVRLPAAHNAGSRKPSPSTTFYRGRIRDSDNNSTTDYIAVQKLLTCADCAHYKVYFSLANIKYAGTAMLVNTKTTQLPTSVRYNLQKLDVKKTVHDTDGRVIFAKFPAFSILHTYVPNNGWGPDHFERRRKWDEAMKSFMVRKKEAGVKVIWIGDLNVAPQDEDLSNPSYFRKQMARPGGRQAPAKTKTGEVFQVPPEYIGQPGCTDAERRQFKAILNDGDIIDVFREQNPGIDNVFSWSSTGGMGGNGMRIDHCIASKSLLPHLGTVTVLSDCYMGSDHCPVMVTYNEKTELVIDVSEASRESAGGGEAYEEANVEVNVDRTIEVNGEKTKEK